MTTYLTEDLLHLYGGKSVKGFLGMRVEPASDCLFASPQGKALVHLESLDSEEQMKRYFTWKGEKNAYSGFDKMLEMQPADGEVVMRRFDPEAWQKTFANIVDANAVFLKQKLDFSSMEERPLAQVLPEDFRLSLAARQEVQTGVGAELDTLPLPVGGQGRDAAERSGRGVSREMKKAIDLQAVLAQEEGGSAQPFALFALLNLGVIDSLASGAMGATEAVRLFYNADNCLFIRKQRREKIADRIMSHGAQLADLFDALSPEEAHREFQREIEIMRTLCRKLLEKEPLAA